MAMAVFLRRSARGTYSSNLVKFQHYGVCGNSAVRSPALAISTPAPLAGSNFCGLQQARHLAELKI